MPPNQGPTADTWARAQVRAEAPNRYCDSGRFLKLSPLMVIGDHPYHRVNLGA